MDESRSHRDARRRLHVVGNRAACVILSNDYRQEHAMRRFREEVVGGDFPSTEHSFGPIPDRSTPDERGLHAAGETGESGRGPIRG